MRQGTRFQTDVLGKGRGSHETRPHEIRPRAQHVNRGSCPTSLRSSTMVVPQSPINLINNRPIPMAHHMVKITTKSYDGPPPGTYNTRDYIPNEIQLHTQS